MITRAMKSTPTSALNIITNLLPLDIMFKENATACCRRLMESNTWQQDSGLTGHAKIIDNVENLIAVMMIQSQSNGPLTKDSTSK